MHSNILIYTALFVFGAVAGRLSSVCINCIPKEESAQILSGLLGIGRSETGENEGRIQTLILEAVMGLAYMFIVFVNGKSAVSILYCLMLFALITLSVIDFLTYEIPFGFNVLIFALGIVRLCIDYTNWKTYLIGFPAVSLFLYLLLVISKGRAIGGGDVKLMAACGLLIGWKLIILAFLLGCVTGVVIHTIRMRVQKEEGMLAMGPYLSAGVIIAALWGEKMISWYMGFYQLS